MLKLWNLNLGHITEFSNPMTRLAWMTDIHLNFLSTLEIDAWLTSLKHNKFHALLITGDIGEANTLHDYLMRMRGRLGVPIYFVLGNHDYYHSSIAEVRTLVHQLHEEHIGLNWLPIKGIVQLNQVTGLIGHGAWADGGYGDFFGSSLMLNDYVLIDDLKDRAPPQRLEQMTLLAQEAATYIAKLLPQALQRFDHVYVALHVPPFQQACWYDGKTPPDDDDYLPHFTCKRVGDVLLEIAAQAPDKQITVLCGHTHGSGEVHMRQNLHIITEGAIYGQPTIARILSL